MSPQQTVALMAMLLYANTQPRNVRPEDADQDALVSLAKKLYNASGTEQV